jgi:hypothetical protein
VGLAVPLDLGGLVQRLPFGPRLGVSRVHLPTREGLFEREHDAVAEVAVVGDRQHPPPGLVLVQRHPIPQIDRIVAPLGRQRRIGRHHPGFGLVVAIDDDAVEVVAAGGRRPLVADESGEVARIVGVLGRLDRLVPGRSVGRGTGTRLECRREGPLGEAGDDLDRHLYAILAAPPDHLVPALPRRVRQEVGVTLIKAREETHVVGVVGHDDEVERPRELHGKPGGRDHLFATSEAVRILREEPRPEGARVHRHRRMDVGVPPEHLRREVAPGVRGKGRLLREGALQRFAGRDGILGHQWGGRRGQGHQ